MSDGNQDLRTRIAAAIAQADQDWCSDRPLHEDMADAVIRELAELRRLYQERVQDMWAEHIKGQGQ